MTTPRRIESVTFRAVKDKHGRQDIEYRKTMLAMCDRLDAQKKEHADFVGKVEAAMYEVKKDIAALEREKTLKELSMESYERLGERHAEVISAKEGWELEAVKWRERAHRAEAQLLEMASMVADYMDGGEPTDERQAVAQGVIDELDFSHPSTDVAEPTPEAPDGKR